MPKGSREVPQKNWAKSVEPFWRLLDTNRQAKYIYTEDRYVICYIINIDIFLCLNLLHFHTMHDVMRYKYINNIRDNFKLVQNDYFINSSLKGVYAKNERGYRLWYFILFRIFHDLRFTFENIYSCFEDFW